MNYKKKIQAKLNRIAVDVAPAITPTPAPAAPFGGPLTGTHKGGDNIDPNNVEANKEELAPAAAAPAKPSRKSEGVDYEAWSKRFNNVISRQFGLGMDDFPDWDSYSAWDDDMTPVEAFRSWKEDQGDDFDF